MKALVNASMKERVLKEKRPQMPQVRTSAKDAESVTQKLLNYCRTNDWAGYDPYDALNSELFKSLRLLDFRIPRLVLTQGLKRSPINLRPLVLVPKSQNPKALALFLTSFLKLSKLGLLGDEDLAGMMVEKLVGLRSPNTPYYCWGYSFPWQTRTIVVPRGAPNIVCTIFVANALLDAYDVSCDSRCLNMAISAAGYILGLFWTESDTVASFSYPLSSLRSQIHNANFLGAAYLCRVYKYCGQKKFLEPALKAARFSASKQQEDGSWHYGEWPTQKWKDNFHTGYNLSALRSIGRYYETSEFESNVALGFKFYREHFFREDGAPRYFHDRTYPIDVHSVAQSIITLLEFRDLDEGNLQLAHSVFKWAKANLWDERGYFYYQKLPWGTIKIPYMRWGQAWMLLALSSLLEQSDQAAR